MGQHLGNDPIIRLQWHGGRRDHRRQGEVGIQRGGRLGSKLRHSRRRKGFHRSGRYGRNFRFHCRGGRRFRALCRLLHHRGEVQAQQFPRQLNRQGFFVQPPRRIDHIQRVFRHQIGIPQWDAGGLADVDQTGRILENDPFQGLFHRGTILYEQIFQRQRTAAVQVDDPPEKQRFLVGRSGCAEGDCGFHGQDAVKIHGRGIAAPDGVRRAADVGAVVGQLFLPEQGQNGVGNFFLQILLQRRVGAFKGRIIHCQALTASIFLLMAAVNADAIPGQFRGVFLRQYRQSRQQKAEGHPKGQNSFHEWVPPYFSSAPPGRRMRWTGPHTVPPRPFPAENSEKAAGGKQRR